MSAKVSKIHKHTGIAGQFEISAVVEYEGEAQQTVSFVGSVYGGPIVMVTPYGQTFVSASVTDRIGSQLTPAWVERFFTDKEKED
jgi:hypothetical protein